MSTVNSVVVGGQEYEVILSEGVVVGLRRFSPKHKVWVELRFDVEVSNASEELLGLLESAFLDEQMSASAL